ncbi:DUF2188 domain-containing protein [Streptomyces sp. P1-3]|uniref:DUF2188 domain-containing protein n=1 Tax=Streptomyces sp. P1-3 TaxID=3421658 RepID=UPI003D36F1E1
MARTRYWVVPDEGIWELRRERTYLSSHAYKAQAVAEGRRIARENPPSQLLIMHADGTFETEATYGADPYPPKG